MKKSKFIKILIVVFGIALLTACQSQENNQIQSGGSGTEPAAGNEDSKQVDGEQDASAV